MSKTIGETEEIAERDRIMSGTGAVAAAVRDVGVDVIAAYPITPQTEIVESLAEYVETGELNASFSRVESEHSALSGVMGASQGGARTFTATASQGLLYMSEMVWWTAGSRLPVVMAVANRAFGPPWNLWESHTDALSQRDAGWIQVFAGNVQEAYDLTLAAYRLSERDDIMLPTMVNLDGFTLAHTMQPLSLVSPDVAHSFTGEINVPHRFDTENPRGFGALAGGSDYWRFRKKIMDTMDTVPSAMKETFNEFAEISGRTYDLIRTYRTEDADRILIGLGTLAREAEVTVDLLRKEGIKAGVVRPILQTPFPDAALRKAVEAASDVVVLDRSTSFGRGGILTEAVELAIDKPVASVLVGIGGQNVNYQDMRDIAKAAKPGDRVWFGGGRFQ